MSHPLCPNRRPHKAMDLLALLALLALTPWGSAPLGATGQESHRTVTDLRLCEDPKAVILGPRGGTCSALSGPCGTAVLDEKGDCCSIRPRPAGIPCGDGGQCNGTGGCVPPSQKPDIKAPVHAGLTGTEHWVRILGGDGEPGIWYVENGVEIQADGLSVAVVRSGEPFSLSEVIVGTSPENLPFGAGAILGPPGTRTIMIPTKRDGQPRMVCLVAGGLGSIDSVSSDCSSEGTIRMGCPDRSGPFSCEPGIGTLDVTGPDLVMAWEHHDDAGGQPVDLLPLILPGVFPILFPTDNPYRCDPGCSFGEFEPCRNACGQFSVRYCNPFNGCWGPCESQVDVCDNRDNDCDGLIDEGGATACDDGLACTQDQCVRLLERPFAPSRPGENPFDDIFRPPPPGRVASVCTNTLIPRCHDPSRCTLETCALEPPVPRPGERVVRVDERNFCWEIQDDGWCTESWDSCDCNGREACMPDSPGSDVDSGCVGIDRPPCDTDASLCTIEGCCEANPECRFGIADREILGVGCTDLPGSWQPRSPAPGDDSQVYCLNRDTVAGTRLWSDVACDDGNSCTNDSCEPATGLCNFASRPFGVSCVGPDGRRETTDGCGAFECRFRTGAPACVPVENDSAFRVDCPAMSVPVSSVHPYSFPLTRQPFARVGEAIRYRDSSGLEWQSCHRASCNGGSCSILTTGDCPPATGCTRFRCGPDPYENGGGVRGCVRFLDDSACSAALPEGNQCLVADCAGDGGAGGVDGCRFRPDVSLCPLPSTSCEGSSPGEASRRRCDPTTGRCTIENCLF